MHQPTAYLNITAPKMMLSFSASIPVLILCLYTLAGESQGTACPAWQAHLCKHFSTCSTTIWFRSGMFLNSDLIALAFSNDLSICNRAGTSSQAYPAGMATVTFAAFSQFVYSDASKMGSVKLQDKHITTTTTTDRHVACASTAAGRRSTHAPQGVRPTDLHPLSPQ